MTQFQCERVDVGMWTQSIISSLCFCFMVTACLPFLETNNPIPTPINQGPTVFMGIEDVSDENNPDDYQTLINTIRKDIPAYSSWFTITENPGGAGAILLFPKITSVRTDTSSGGRNAYRVASVRVLLSVIDLATGDFVAMTTAKASFDDRQGNWDYRKIAIERATSEALFNLVIRLDELSSK